MKLARLWAVAASGGLSATAHATADCARTLRANDERNVASVSLTADIEADTLSRATRLNLRLSHAAGRNNRAAAGGLSRSATAHAIAICARLRASD